MKNLLKREFKLKKRNLNILTILLVLALLATSFPPAQMFCVKEAKAENASTIEDQEHHPLPAGINAFRDRGEYYPSNRIYFDYSNNGSPDVNPIVKYYNLNEELIYENRGASSENPDWGGEEDTGQWVFYYIIVRPFDDNVFRNNKMNPAEIASWTVSLTEDQGDKLFEFHPVRRSTPAPAATSKPNNNPQPVQTPYQYKYYNITYELDGGTNNPQNPSTYREDQTVFLEDAWKTGAKFDGWYITPEGTGIVASISNRNITVYAHFTPYTYKLNYDLAGGVMQSGNPNTYNYGEALNIPIEPTKADNTFVGWSFSPLGTDPFKTLPAGCSGDLMLYAVWSDAKNNIVYDTESFHGAVNPNAGLTAYKRGEPVILDYPDQNDENYPKGQYYFLGYSYKFGDSEWAPAPLAPEKDNQAMIDTKDRNGTLTVKAVWIKNGSTLKSYRNLDNLHALDPAANVDRHHTDGTTEIDLVRHPTLTDYLSIGYEADNEELEHIGYALSPNPEGNIPDVCYLVDKDETYILDVAKDAFQKGIYHGEEDKYLTFYAIWGYKSYKINYVGIDRANLPKIYNKKETLTLPTAEEINKGELDPAFSENYEFIRWSQTENGDKPVTTLGKNGDVTAGEVTLYAVRQLKLGTEDVELPYRYEEQSRIIQVNTPDLMYKDAYALVYVKPEYGFTDPKSLKIIEPPDDSQYTDYKGHLYWEICPVPASEYGNDNGSVVFGLKLKDGLTKEQIDEVAHDTNCCRILFRVRGMDNNGKGDDFYHIADVALKVDYKLPEYKLDKSSIKIDFTLGFDIDVRETTGTMPSDFGNGKWTLDYVDSDGKVVREIHVKLKNKTILNLSNIGDNYVVYTMMRNSYDGYVRFRNSKWISGTEVLAPFKITLFKDKNFDFDLDKERVVMNNRSNTEKEEIKITVNGASRPEKYLDRFSLKLLSDYLKADLDKRTGIITITGAKNAPTAARSLKVTYQKSNTEKIEKKIKILVYDRPKSEGLKLEKAGGTIDPLFDSKIYIKPTIKYYAGEIKSVAVAKNNKCKNDTRTLYKAEWDGEYIVLSHGKDWVYQQGGYEETIRATLTTGVTVTGKIKIVPQAGETDFFASGVQLPMKKGSSVTSGIFCNYTYKYYTGPKTYEKRLYVMDLENPEKFLIQIDDNKPVKRNMFHSISITNNNNTISGTQVKIEVKNRLFTATVMGEPTMYVSSPYELHPSGYYGLTDQNLQTKVSISCIKPE